MKTSKFRDIFRNEGVELDVEREVFDPIADLVVEYKNGARSLRGLFEELITPVLFLVPDDPSIRKVVVKSLFAEPLIVRSERGAEASPRA